MRDAKLLLALLSGLLATMPAPALAHGRGGSGHGHVHPGFVLRGSPFLGGGLGGLGSFGAFGGGPGPIFGAGRPDLFGRSGGLGGAPAPSGGLVLLPAPIDREAAARAERLREETLEREIDAALADAPAAANAGPELR